MEAFRGNNQTIANDRGSISSNINNSQKQIVVTGMEYDLITQKRKKNKSKSNLFKNRHPQQPIFPATLESVNYGKAMNIMNSQNQASIKIKEMAKHSNLKIVNNQVQRESSLKTNIPLHQGNPSVNALRYF